MQEHTVQLVTFELGAATLALDISAVQEISRNSQLTKVPHAPKYVRGIANLRGDVVTILNLHSHLGILANPATKESRILIIKDASETVGLWVDRVSDILPVQVRDLSPPPNNLQGISRTYVQGVFQANGKLILKIDLQNLLNCCHNHSPPAAALCL
ncbi:Chemotaxis protein CheW [Aureliella helgolandensis]|uniref:Chemotaxis protein CheW n=2 Tax=Aureliella helgolandensis TaxID=2527968 RepID=A0A518G5Y7_9BACT|nr:Chemotaxis protein CheW [Aureliella helgolandensis]